MVEDDTPDRYLAPAHFVEKGDSGKLRLVTDYKGINPQTRRIPHGYPTMQELRDSIDPEAKRFLRLDCVSAYYQIPLDEESRDKTSFICDTETGVQRLRYRVCPMGHTSSSDLWVRETDRIFMGPETHPWLSKQMDDLLLEATGPEDQLDEEMARKLTVIAQKAEDNNVVISIVKLDYGSETTYSGFHLEAVPGGVVVMPDPKRTEAI